MHKKPILIILLICAVLTTGLVYINNVLLPVRFKELVSRELSKALKRTVTIEDLYYVPLKGIVLKNVAVQDRTPQAQNFFSAPEIRVSVFYLPLFTQKKIVIPSLIVDHPTLVIDRSAGGVWNIEDLLALSKPKDAAPSAAKEKDPPAVYLTGLTITNGTLIIADQTLSSSPIETIQNINIRASLALPKNMKAEIKIFPKTPDTLKAFADLNYDFITEDFLCRFNLQDFSVTPWAPYFNKPGFALEHAKVNTAALTLAQRNKKISGRGEILFDKTKVRLQDQTTIEAFPSLTLKDIVVENNVFTANGALALKQNEIFLDKEKKINGDLSYDFVVSEKDGKVTTDGNISAANLAGQLGPEISFTAQPQGRARVVYDDGALESQSRLNFQKTEILAKPEMHISANPVVDLSFTAKPEEKTGVVIAYLGSVSLQGGQATGIPYIKTAENLSGNFSFSPDKVVLNAFSAFTNNIPLSASGAIENFKDPVFDVVLTAKNADLSAWKALLAQSLKDETLDIKGSADLKLEFKGKPKKLSGTFVEGAVSLKDAAFKSALVKDGLSNISGEMSYLAKKFDASYFLPDEATWKDLAFTYGGQNYVLNGSLKYNNIDTTLTQGGLAMSLQAKIFPDRINIVGLKGRYKNSQLSAKGEIVYPRNNEKTKFDLRATADLYLEHLTELIPALKEKLKDVSPTGLCKTEILFTGDPAAWRDWTCAVTLASDEASLYHYRLNNVVFKYRQRDRFINECLLNSLVYDGTVSLEGSSDLSVEAMPYKTKIAIKDVSLEKLKNDSPLKDKELAGLISGAYEGTGPLSNLRLSQGNGNLSVKEGKLWRFDVFDGLAQLLFVPEKQNIALDSAEGNFSVLNEKVMIQDGVVKGNQVALTCNGNITFNGDLDLDVSAEFDEGTIKGSQSVQKSIAAVLSQGGNFLTVKITGTIQKPQYVPKGMDVLRKTKDLIFDALPNIFQ